MSEPISSAATTIQSIRVPAALRSVIIENDLAANDIAVLLLILERTLDNVYPAKPSTALSIRHIAELNHCSPKGAENSVKKLRNLNLITHEVFPATMRPGQMGLNCAKFWSPAPQTDQVGTNRPASSVAQNDALADRERIESEISAIRDLLFNAVNSGRRKREDELPDPSLAALFLDHFGGSSAVQDYLEGINADAKKRRTRIKGYGYYSKLLHKLRDSAVYKRYVDSIRLTEPMAVIAPAWLGRSTHGAGEIRLRPSFVRRQLELPLDDD